MRFKIFLKEGAATFDELSAFYKKASKNEIEEMKEYVMNDEWDKFIKLLKKVLGIK